MTLHGHSGLSQAAWERRVADGAQGLTLRSQQRLTATLTLRLPTPNQAALQAAVSLAGPAGSSVTELKVLQQASTEQNEGAHTAWLRSLPAAFPTLTTLTISRLCGCLPPVALLPHLRVLSVHLCPRPHRADPAIRPSPGRSLWAQCSSLAPYLQQLTALHQQGLLHKQGLLPTSRARSVGARVQKHNRHTAAAHYRPAPYRDADRAVVRACTPAKAHHV